LEVQPTIGQGGRKGLGMSRDAPPRRPLIREHEKTAGRSDAPSLLPSDAGTEARLPIERCEHCLEIWDHGLHLDHQEKRLLWAQGQDIHRAALSVDREADLGRADPPEATEPNHDPLDQRRMISVEETVQGLAIEVEAHEEPGANGGGDTVQGANGQGVRCATFEARDQGLRNRC
jgi:hypothetical protein